MLTNRQKDALAFIKKYIAEKGFPPSIREVGSGLKLSSSATAFAHVKNLEDKGYIKIGKNKSRNIELLCENEYLNKDESIIKVPLLGKIAAGNPITLIENPNEYFDLPSYLVPINSEVFTLHVDGESMINKGIYNNDFVIVKKCSSAKNGDVIVALTDEEEVTLKTFYKEKDFIRLKPENDHMEDIILPSVTILGIAIGLYRKF